MRILHIYKDYPPILGGIEGHVRLLAEGEAGRGHDVTVLVTNPAGRPAGLRTTVAHEDGVRVIRAARVATVASTPLSPALSWQLLRSQADVVHLHFPYPVGEVSQWLLRRGRHTVMTYHSDIVRQAGILRLYAPLLRQVLRRMDAIIIGSPAIAASTYLAPLAARLRLITYGIPLARFAAEPPAEALALARSRYLAGAAQAAARSLPVLLFVGRLRYYKGLDYLIRALPQIPARLLVAGTGPMAAEWQALAAALGVAPRITWLGDVPDADLPAVYHLADLFVLPASQPSEAFGLVQVEAMAAGLPVVCTELGTGTSYVNRDGVTGRVVAPRDPAALASAINELLTRPDFRRTMGRAAQERAQAEFALDTMVERVLDLYRSLQ